MNNSASPDHFSFPIEIDCCEVKHFMDSGLPCLFIDCRTAQEHAICRLPQGHLIPIQELPERVNWIRQHLQPRLVVYCHHGVRSLRAARWLRNHGLGQAQSMRGGLEAWSQDVDPALPRY